MKTIKESANATLLRRLLRTTADGILDVLSTRQHVRPHDSVEAAVRETTRLLGVCPMAIERALQWLGVDPAQPIGRLRRTELTQLATAIHRFWRQTAAQTLPAPGTA